MNYLFIDYTMNQSLLPDHLSVPLGLKLNKEPLLWDSVVENRIEMSLPIHTQVFDQLVNKVSLKPIIVKPLKHIVGKKTRKRGMKSP
jgi:hypothetical protein